MISATATPHLPHVEMDRRIFASSTSPVPVCSPLSKRGLGSAITLGARPTLDDRDMPASPTIGDVNLAFKHVIGTTATNQSSFCCVANAIAYTAGAGAIVGAIEDKKIVNSRLYCASTKYVQGLQSKGIPVPPRLSSFDLANGASTGNDTDCYGFIKPTNIGIGTATLNNPGNSGTPLNNAGDDISSLGLWPVKIGSMAKDKMKTTSCLALSPDARLLAVGETGHQPRIFIYSLARDSNQRPLAIINEHRFGINSLAFSPCGRYLASLGTTNDGFLHIWQLSLREGQVYLHSSNRCISVINDIKWISSTVLVTVGVRHIRIWRADPTYSPNNTGGKVCVLTGKNAVLADFSSQTFTSVVTVGDNLAVVSTDSGILSSLQYDGEDSNNKTMATPVFTARIALGFSVKSLDCDVDDYKLWAAGSRIQSIDLGDFLASTLPQTTIAQEILTSLDNRPSYSALFVVAKNSIAVLQKNSEIYWTALQDSDNIVEQVRLTGESSRTLNGIRYIGDESNPGRILTWASDGMVRIYRFSSGECIYQCRARGLSNTELTVAHVSFEKESENYTLYTADAHGVLRICELESTGEIAAGDKPSRFQFQAHIGRITDMDYKNCGSYELLATCSRDRTIQIFVRESGKNWSLLQTLYDAHKGTIQRLRFGSAGDRLVSCSADRTVQLHRALFKEEDGSVAGFISEKVISLKSTPNDMIIDYENERFLVAADRQIYVYKQATGDLDRFYRVFDEDGAQLSDICLGKIGKQSYLAGMGSDKCLRVCDHSTGRVVASNWGHSVGVSGLCWVYEQGYISGLASSGNDGCIFLWKLDEAASGTHESPQSLSPGTRTSPTRKILSKAELAKFLPPKRSTSPISVAKQQQRGSPVIGSPSTPTSMRRPQLSKEPSSGQNTPTTMSAVRRMKPATPYRAPTTSAKSPARDDLGIEDICLELEQLRSRLTTGFSESEQGKSALKQLKMELRSTLYMIDPDDDAEEQSKQLVTKFGNDLLDLIDRKLHARLDNGGMSSKSLNEQ